MNNLRRNRDPLVPARDEKTPSIKAELSLDREQDQAVFLADVEGQEQAVKWCNVRTQNTFKRFHPLDQSLRIGALTLSPDGQTAAFRVEVGGSLGLPVFCDLSSEAITLVAPDAAMRSMWLSRLASCATDLINLWLQPAAGGEPPVRATILPVPGEIVGNNPRQLRLNRLAKFAKGLLDEPLSPSSLTTQNSTCGSIEEIKFFFDYLRGDYRAAEVRLDTFVARAQSANARLRWLCLRAQILLGQSEVERARGIIEYVSRATRTESHQLEDTPLGPVLTSLPSPENDWAKLLSQKATEIARRRSPKHSGNPDDPENLEPTPGVWEHRRRPQLPFAPDDQEPEGLAPINSADRSIRFRDRDSHRRARFRSLLSLSNS